MSAKFTAIYCRTCGSSQDSSDAAEQQREELTRFAKERGLDNIRVYTDMGLHGMAFSKCPAFTLLQAEIDAGLVGTVIVKKLSRISRNTADVVGWLRGIRAKGVGFITADQPDLTADDILREYDTAANENG